MPLNSHRLKSKGEQQYLLEEAEGTERTEGTYGIFEDAGWAYLGVKRGWRYFWQKAVAGELPEIYTDNESKVKKIQRTMGYQLFSLFVILGYGFLYASWGPAELTLSLFVIISLIFAYSLVRLRMRQLSA